MRVRLAVSGEGVRECGEGARVRVTYAETHAGECGHAGAAEDDGEHPRLKVKRRLLDLVAVGVAYCKAKDGGAEDGARGEGRRDVVAQLAGTADHERPRAEEEALGDLREERGHEGQIGKLGGERVDAEDKEGERDDDGQLDGEDGRHGDVPQVDGCSREKLRHGDTCVVERLQRPVQLGGEGGDEALARARDIEAAVRVVVVGRVLGPRDQARADLLAVVALVQHRCPAAFLCDANHLATCRRSLLYNIHVAGGWGLHLVPQTTVQ